MNAKIEAIAMVFPGEGELTLLLARTEAGEVVGTACVKHADPFVAELARLFVREEFRGRGIGAALVNEAEQLARNFGCVSLSFGVNPVNREARTFYHRLGYAIAFRFGDGDLLFSKPVKAAAIAAAPEPIGGAS